MAQTVTAAPHRPLFGLTRRRIVLIALAILLLNPIALFNYVFIGSALLARLSNQVVLDRFAQPFFETALPAEVTEISRESYLRYEGAHGCSFVVERLVETSLTQQTLQMQFDDIGYVMPHGEPHFMDPEGLARVQVKPVEGTTNRYTLLLWPEGHYVTGWLDIGCTRQ
jgi:hypothetical protein